MKKKRLDDYTSSLCWRKKFLVMRLVYFLMVGFVVLVPTSVSAQNKMISLEIRSETLSSVLMKIKDQSGVNILYNENGQVIDNNTLVAITLLIAQSNPKEKEILIALVMNFLNNK